MNSRVKISYIQLSMLFRSHHLVLESSLLQKSSLSFRLLGCQRRRCRCLNWNGKRNGKRNRKRNRKWNTVWNGYLAYPLMMINLPFPWHVPTIMRFSRAAPAPASASRPGTSSAPIPVPVSIRRALITVFVSISVVRPSIPIPEDVGFSKRQKKKERGRDRQYCQ